MARVRILAIGLLIVLLVVVLATVGYRRGRARRRAMPAAGASATIGQNASGVFPVYGG